MMFGYEITLWQNSIRAGIFMVMTAKTKLSGQLKKAIHSSGKTIYRIAKDCEIAESHLHFFLKGKRGLGIDKIDRLAEYLQLELRKKASKKPKKT